MTERRTLSLEDELVHLPVHGPDGRIAYVRRLLGMRQSDFAEAIGTSRETVSHWENIGPDGNPRSRVRRRNSASIASLVRQRLGERVHVGTFFDPGETALDVLVKELHNVKQELSRLRVQVEERGGTQAVPKAAAGWEGSDEELLDANQAAALLTVDSKTLLTWAREGRIPCIRLADRVVRWTRPMLREIRDGAIEPLRRSYRA